MKQLAIDIGFDSVGVCKAESADSWSRFEQWINRGYAGEMQYLSDRADAYRHPRHVMDGVQNIVMLTVNYRTDEPIEVKPGQGRISRYAWGPTDYHDLVHSRLKSLIAILKEREPNSHHRGVIDTAPLLERDFARLAGVGWQGKNTLLLNQQQGSLFFLAALLTDLPLDHDEPFAADHCGTCTACLDACPTDAFPQPYVLDATKCISYLTIELRNDIPESLRNHTADWLFGCDICQDVCPWNQKAPTTAELAFQPNPNSNPVDLIAVFDLDDDGFRERFRRTPLWRSKRHGILRNAAIILGSQKHAEAVPSLIKGLNDAHPLVRSASSWALGQIGCKASLAALRAALPSECNDSVVREVQSAIGRSNPPDTE